MAVTGALASFAKESGAGRDGGSICALAILTPFTFPISPFLPPTAIITPDTGASRKETLVRFALIPALLVTTILTLSACGDTGKGGTVDVTLKEWSVEPSVDTLPEGPIILNTKNQGPDEDHELVIIKTDFASDQLPTKSDGSVDEGASGIDVKGRVTKVGPGDKNSGSYTLDPGKYIFICNRVNEIGGQKTSHYAQGMRTAFTVTASD